jgi:hypothetical protein
MREGKELGLPIIRNLTDNRTICLVDTGANMPVWCTGENTFKQCYEDASQLQGISILKGFGKGYEICNVYSIPNFKLSDGNNTIIYKNLPIAVLSRDYAFELIISNTMINHLNFSINTFAKREGIFKINPYIKISSYTNSFNVGCKYKNINEFPNPQNIYDKIHSESIVDSIYIFNKH